MYRRTAPIIPPRKPKEPDKVSEKLVHRSLKKVIEENGGLIFKNHPLTNAGIPDVIVHIRRSPYTFYVETKTTGEECTKIQVEFQRALHAQGIPCYVLDRKVNTFIEIFEKAYTEYKSPHYNKNPFKNDSYHAID